MTAPTSPTPRDRILETAGPLFYAQGYRAVGIDKIIAQSGVAKMTFYKYFPSKDELIATYLREANAGFWRWLNGLTAGIDSPKQRLEIAFDGIAKLASSANCMGCAFAHAAAEFPDQDNKAHAAALEHKVAVLNWLRTEASALGANDPEFLASSLMLVIDGAWTAARMFGAGNHASRAGETARVLIGAAEGGAQWAESKGRKARRAKG
jgi:AcrR family transcriptional regulator